LIVFDSPSPEASAALGRAIGEAAAPGLVIAFRGGLGAGKTTLAKGVARGLGVRDEVTSPTYTIASEYEGRLPLRHVDAYRLRSADEFEDSGGELWLAPDGVCLVEWSENVEGALPRDAVSVAIEIGPGTARRIRIEGASLEEAPGFRAAVDRLRTVHEAGAET